MRTKLSSLRLKQIVDAKRLSPRSSIRWRLNRANRLARCKRLRKLAVDDDLTYWAAVYIRRRGMRNQKRAARMLESFKEEHSDVYMAFQIFEDPRFGAIKCAVTMRLLAGETDEDISRRVGIPAEVVHAFHELFVWVRQFLSAPDIIYAKLFGRKLGTGPASLNFQGTMLYYAYTFGSELVDLVLFAAERVKTGKDLDSFLQQSRVQFQTQIRAQQDFSRRAASTDIDRSTQVA